MSVRTSIENGFRERGYDLVLLCLLDRFTLGGALGAVGHGGALKRPSFGKLFVAYVRAYEVGFVVSGDADLLERDEQDPPVIPPAEFEVRLSQS